MKSFITWLGTHKIPLLVFVAITAAWFIWITGQPDMRFGRGDAIMQGDPGTVFMVDSIRNRHEMPFWNPYLLGGMPCLASMNANVTIHPVYFMYHLLGFNQEQLGKSEFCIAIFLAGFFMYLFLAELGVSRIAAVIGGIFFMHCGDIITLTNPGHMYNIASIALIPVVFFFYERGFRTGKLVYFVLSGCVLGGMSLLGVYQLMLYTIICMFLYLLYKLFAESAPKKMILYFGAAVAMAPLVSAPQIMESFFFIRNTFRAGSSYEFFTSWSFHPAELIIYIYPRFFGLLPPPYWGHSQFWLNTTAFGIVPLIPAFTAVFFKMRDKKVAFFSILAFVVLILSFGGFTPLYKILYHIPVINGFRSAARWLCFFAFSVIVLSAFGIDFLLRLAAKERKPEENRNHFAFFIGLGILVLASFIVYVVFTGNPASMMESMKAWNGIKVSFVEHGYKVADYIPQIYKMISEDMLKFSAVFAFASALVVLAFFGKINKIILTIMLVALFAVDMLTFWDQFKLVEKKQDDPVRAEIVSVLAKQNNSSPFRVFPTGQLSMLNWFTAEKIESVEGYHSAPLKNYYEMREQGVMNNLNYLALLNVKYLISLEKLNHLMLKPVSEANLNIYENVMQYPRAFLAGEVMVLKTPKEIADKFKDPGYNPVKTMILQEEVKEKIEPLKINGSEVRITSYTPNNVVLLANAPVDCMLFLGDIYYPEWEAYVDGERVKMYQAYGAMRAVHLTKGTHSVEFVFGKGRFYLGMLISLLTLVGIFTVFVVVRPKL